MAEDKTRLEAALQAAHTAGDTAAARRVAGQLRELQTIEQNTARNTSDIQLSRNSFQAQDATTMQQIRLGAGFFLNHNPKARKEMLTEVLGDQVTFETDDSGRDIVVFGDERAYLNRPGFGMDDAVTLFGEVVKFLPASKLATTAGAAGRGILTTGRGLLRAMGVGAAASGATDVTGQVASMAVGTEQIDPLQAGVAAAGGGLGEAGAAGVRGATSLIPTIGRKFRFTSQGQQALNKAEGLGINLAGQPGTQVQQVTAAARSMASAQEGAALPAVAQGVRGARNQMRRATGEAFDTARSTRALVEAQDATELSARVVHGLVDFDLGAPGMASVNRLVGQLKELGDPTFTFSRKLNAMEGWRRRARAMNPKDGSPAAAATERAISVYDRWIDDLFNRDMIVGDADAIQAWRLAREGWSMFKGRFDANRIIRDLGRKETTAEQMSQWLFNANAVGAKREAGLVVGKLNEILGVNSPEMNALRADVILDIAEPLFRDTPDIHLFVSQYFKWLGRNPTLKKELFPDELGTQLDDLVRFSRGIGQRAGTSVQALKPNDVLGRLLKMVTSLGVGHGIAQGGARIQAGGVIINFIRRITTGAAARRNALQDYLGLDPTRQLIPGATAIGAAVAPQIGANPADPQLQQQPPAAVAQPPQAGVL